MKRSANATWNGSLKEGKGVFSVASGAIKDQTYSFPPASRTPPAPTRRS